ncbi:hypothetical protein D9M72_584400 [compost metagenome]
MESSNAIVAGEGFIDAASDRVGGDDATGVSNVPTVKNILGHQLNGAWRRDSAKPQATKHQLPPFQLAAEQNKNGISALNPN